MFLWRTSQETLQSLSNWCKDCFWINLLLSFKVFTLLTLYLPAGQIRGQVSVCRAWNALPNNVEHQGLEYIVIEDCVIRVPTSRCQAHISIVGTGLGKYFPHLRCFLRSLSNSQVPEKSYKRDFNPAIHLGPEYIMTEGRVIRVATSRCAPVADQSSQARNWNLCRWISGYRSKF